MARQPRTATRARRTKRAPAIAFDAITLEGGLIAPAMLTQIARIEANAQTAADYGIARGLILRDEIARAYRIAQAHYADLTAHPEPSLAATQRFTEALLRDVLEFRDLDPIGRHDRDGDIYPVTFEGLSGRVPVVVVPPADGIDRVSPSLTAAGRRGSAASVVQDWLNAEDAALWGLACCGTRLRLLRDNPSLTRPAYIEADLDAIFTNEGRVDFAVLWLLLHASRFGKPTDAVTDCTLERWRLAGLKEGEVARDRLRDGVEEALLALGTGFLSHPANGELRKFVGSGVIPPQAYFEQCLHLVYRLIFLFVAEDRDLLHPKQTAAIKRQRYAEGYSVSALRQSSVRRSAYDAHADRWEALQVIFRGLTDGEEELGLPALSGLFEPGRMDNLESCSLANRDLMKAVHRLAWLKGEDSILPVNWRDMQTEELGSVYESLLELTPRISPSGREMLFAVGSETKGNARKTSGSYYTPDSLVQALLDTVIDPVMDQAVAAANDPVRALLELRIIDPACGSGHFLLAAARRLASRVARSRNGGVASAEQYREAMRDVVRRCIYGVDRNPMAVDLAKVALWIESLEPGKPLGFLDANLVCGDALLGTYAHGADLDSLLDAGVPDEAYSALAGDDKITCRKFQAANRDAIIGQGRLDLFGAKSWHVPAETEAQIIRSLRELPEDTRTQRAARQSLWIEAMSDPGVAAKRQAADLYMAAFLTQKPAGLEPGLDDAIPTTNDIRATVQRLAVSQTLLKTSSDIREKVKYLHWGLTFPDVLAAGGFDLVIGNPPWEVMQLGEEEYFAQRIPEIADLKGSQRKQAIADLKISDPQAYAAYEFDKRKYDAANEFARASGRFKLTARGKINTYALFAELFTSLVSRRGRAGVIVPTGIATDATTAPFFASLVGSEQLAQLIDFENRQGIFPAVHRSYKFCLLTTASGIKQADFAFFLTDPVQMADDERSFKLSSKQIALINPNTKTAPVFRSKADADLTAKLYLRAPILSPKEGHGAFRVDLIQNFFSTSNRKDMQLFEEGRTLEPSERLPVMRGAMIEQFVHQAATYELDERRFRDVTDQEQTQDQFILHSDKWISRKEVQSRLIDRRWSRDWMIGWRDICRSTDERTVIASAFPISGTDDTLSVILPGDGAYAASALLANLNSLVLDYIAQQKVGGTHIRKFIISQFPLIPMSAYSPDDLEYVSRRVLELTYTTTSMKPFARDLGYDGSPFQWDATRREHIRAELDAYFAHAYGLTRNEITYVLDPSVAKGEDYPSETFRVLKNNEIKRHGEFRTARMVLSAYDQIALDRSRLAAAE